MKSIKILIFLSLICLNQWGFAAEDTLNRDYSYQEGSPSARKILTTLKDHVDFLEDAIKKSTKRLIISSPFLSANALRYNDLVGKIKEAIDREVDVLIYTDNRLDVTNRGVLKPISQEARSILETNGIRLCVVHHIHCKIVVVDEDLLAIGSCNWLSASRNPNSHYANLEFTTVLSGDGVADEIKQVLAPIESLKSYENEELRNFYEMASIAREGDLNQAKELMAKHASNPALAPIARDILLGLAKDDSTRAIEIAQFLSVHGGMEFTHQIMEELVSNIENLEGYMNFMRNFHRVDHQKTHELLDLMTDHVEATQNVDDEIEELVNLGFSERAKEIYYVAYGSPEARYMLAH